MKTALLFLTAITMLVSFNSVYSQVTFSDVAPMLGVADNGGAAQGVAFVDVNNDGWLDIFLVNNNTPNRLWINQNGIAYNDSTTAWGVNATLPGRGLSCGDFNNDGFIDVMVGGWLTPIILYKNTGTRFIDYTSTAGVGFTGYGGSINWFDYNNDGKLDVLFANDGMPPRYKYFFKNNDLSTFTNVAMNIGLSDSSSTLTVATGDYDNDGDLDIFLGTQSYPGSYFTGILYRNNGNGTFTEVTASSGITTNYYIWGAEWGDYNNDGYLDLFIATTSGLYQLYKNNGNGTFTEVSSTVGITDNGNAYSCVWLDYDNDGWFDLYVARGQGYADIMYRNVNGYFTNVANTIGLVDLLHSSCVSAGDYNNDGYLDLYVNNNGSANRLFKNSGGPNKWVIFRLQGVTSNRSAIGSRVTIKTGNQMQIREVEGGSGGKGQNSLPVEFGIGSATIIDSVIIRWTNGLVQKFANIAPNQIIDVIEGQTIGVHQTGDIVPEKFSLSQNYPNPFNPSTVIRFQVSAGSDVTLKVYDVTGKELQTLVNKSMKPGTYEMSFDGSKLVSGAYFYRITAGDFSETRKMMLIK
jgi:ASPIC and UnbV/FG-GAP-like repeat/Secretion system C-terminal sorting domain